MSSAVDLTIVVPAYNEARRIVVSLETLSDYLRAHDLGTVEVLVVVARGHDDTAELARGQAGAFDMFRVIDAGEAKGKGRDVRLAMQQARGGDRLVMDAELAPPPPPLPTGTRVIQQEVDFIIRGPDLRGSHTRV